MGLTVTYPLTFCILIHATKYIFDIFLNKENLHR